MLSGVTLKPGFASGTTAFTAAVSTGVTQTTIWVIATHSNASVVVTAEDVEPVINVPQLDRATTIGVTETAGDRGMSRT